VNSPNDVYFLYRSPYISGLAFVAAATEMHEIGHTLSLSEADDGPPQGGLTNNFEIYSGSVEDGTPEHLRAGGPTRWSLMARTTIRLNSRPMNGRYFTFSLEEIRSVKEP